MRRNEVFRSMDRIESMVNRTRYDRSTRHPLTDEDIDDFEQAGNIRKGRKPTPNTINAVRKRLKKRNLVRYLRLKSDVRWAQRELTKMGRNPDDLWTVLGE